MSPFFLNDLIFQTRRQISIEGQRTRFRTSPSQIYTILQFTATIFLSRTSTSSENNKRVYELESSQIFFRKSIEIFVVSGKSLFNFFKFFRFLKSCKIYLTSKVSRGTLKKFHKCMN